jgi:CheY-like chemotaxis protein
MESGPLVLVVDDDDDVRETARTILEDEGYATEGARDGASALERLGRAPRPVLILLDLQMPGVDGRGLLRELEASADLASIPVVLITAAGTGSDTAALPYPLLRKPFDLDLFLDLVSSHCPRLWDTDEPPTDEDAPERSADSTHREKCSVCAQRARSRCVTCGESFCLACLDAGPDGRCSRCAAKGVVSRA